MKWYREGCVVFATKLIVQTIKQTSIRKQLNPSYVSDLFPLKKKEALLQL